MKVESILAPERTCASLPASSKKRAIEEIARFIGAVTTTLSAQDIYEGLINREKLGTTAIGHGIAIPHCRVTECSDIVGGLFRLDTPVDFDAIDNVPVSLLFVLLVPKDVEEDHLKALAMLAQRFESEEYRQNLLSAHSDQELYQKAIADVSLSDTG